MTAATVAEGAIAILGSTPRTLRALLEDAPAPLVTAPLDDGWSVRDVLAHLCVIEGPAFRERIELLISADGAAVPNVDEDAILEASGLRGRGVVELLDCFEAARASSLQWLAAQEPDDLARSGVHELAGPISAAEVVNHIAFHDALHLGQIARMLATPADAGRGGLRRFS